MQSSFFLVVELLVLLLHASAEPASPACKLSPPASGRLCGVHGKVIKERYPLYSYQQSDPSRANSVEECALLCARRAWNPNTGIFRASFCVSIHYDAKTRVCQLAQKTVRDAVELSKDPSTPLFYELSCFSCSKVGCEDGTLGLELADTRGFESDVFGPWTTFTDSLVTDVSYGPGYKSRKSVNLTVPHDGTSSLLSIFQSVTFCEDSFYLWSADHKVVAPKGTRNLFGGIRMEAGGISDCGFNRAKVYDGWQHTRGVGTGLGFAQLSLFAGKEDYHVKLNATLFVDNVSVKRFKGPLAAKPGAEDLIVNGGFESGMEKPWYFENALGPAIPKSKRDAQANSEHAHKIVSPGVNSQYAIRIRPTFANGSATIRQRVPTRANTMYLMSMDITRIVSQYYRMNPEPGLWVYMGLETELGRSYYFIFEFPKAAHVVKSLSWPVFSATSDAVAFVQFAFDGESGEFTGRLRRSIDVDNISLREFAEDDLF